MVIMQDEDYIPTLAGITPEITLILGIVLTGLVAIICLYLGFKKRAYEPLKSTRVLTQIAVFSALGFVLSFFAIPMPLITHISFHLFPAFLLTMAYGPYVGMITGAIVGAKGFILEGNWTGPVSNAFFCIIIGALSMYMNPEKRGRPMYMILVNIIIGTWTFGLLHMWLNYAGVVVPMLVMLNLLLSMTNNILYGIIVEVVIHVEQVWDPLTEESTLKWYQDDYVEPPVDIQKKQTTLQVLILNAVLYGWFAFIWLSPSFDYPALGLSMNIYNPLLFVLMMLFVIMMVVACYFVYISERLSLVPLITILGALLTLVVLVLSLSDIIAMVLTLIPTVLIWLFSLYIWLKYLRKGGLEVTTPTEG
ncbi:MAG: energy-coupled thiamine transporter ThiT [Candidatus Hodarchaeales archaeon]|jgi:hypothetical protein